MTYSAIMLRHVSGNKGQGVAGNSYSPATPLLLPYPLRAGAWLRKLPGLFFALSRSNTLPIGCATPHGALGRSERGRERYIRGGDMFRLLPELVGKKM